MKAVILNDTSREKHHGCDRVMENFYTALGTRDVDVVDVNFLNADLDSTRVVSELNRCDVAIINGEGTVHHGNAHAEKLLRVVSQSSAQRKILLNSTYDSNPPHFREYLVEFDQLYVRDTHSKDELAKIEISALVVPDLTFMSSRDSVTKRNSGTLITCSVDRDILVELYNVGQSLSDDALPLSIFRQNASIWERLGEIRNSIAIRDILTLAALLKIIRARAWFTKRACTDHHEFSNELATASFLISGRYHAICMAIKNRTPFIAIDSNTFKIRALLADVGLTRRHMSKEKFLNGGELSFEPFSHEELEKIASFEQGTASKISSMFDAVVSI